MVVVVGAVVSVGKEIGVPSGKTLGTLSSNATPVAGWQAVAIIVRTNSKVVK
jgi:hypothetical protein